jgi:hypothetical protein
MTTDCMLNGFSPRLAAMAGSAVLTMVESSVCMKKPVATSHRRMRSDLSGDIGRLTVFGCGWRHRSIGQVLHEFRRLSDACRVGAAGRIPAEPSD